MAERDYYEVLGVPRDAGADQIKKAYRNLARKHHPDVNPGDKSAEAKFKEAQAAYDVLSDADKKRLYDTYGHAAFSGAGPTPGGPSAEWFAGGPGAGANAAGFENIDFSQFFGPGTHAEFRSGPDATTGAGANIFEELFGRMRGGGRGARKSRPARGQDLEAHVTIPFLTAVKGGETTLELDRGGFRETLSVKIPTGIKSGSRIRLRGRGMPAIEDQPAGDLIVTVDVQPHPYFRREGQDLYVDVPITIGEAVLGAKIDVPTLDGMKTVTIPPGSSTDQKLRLKGQGVRGRGDQPLGDLFAVLKIVAPKNADDDAKRLIEQFTARTPYAPRSGSW
jgi:DnaJ-class molecular chaperone